MSGKQFLRHEPCPKCGSKDNRAVFFNERLKGETWFCYSCNEGFFDVDLAKRKGIQYNPEEEIKPPLVPGSFILPDLEIQEIAHRRIPQLVCERYGVGTDESGNLTFPYHKNEYGTIAAKIKFPKSQNRHPVWIGNSKHVSFFGIQYRPSDEYLVLTEGEEDALAAISMLSDRNKSDYTCWSVPNGARSAAKYVKEYLQELEKFKRVYLCFDNDIEGQKAALACMDILKTGVGYHVELPRIYIEKADIYTKDACDFNRFRRETEFKLAIQQATSRKPATLADTEELRKAAHRRYYDSKFRIGLDTGIQGLNDTLGGWRLSEVTLLLAGIHQGKSTFSRWLLVKQALKGVKCLYMPLEDGDDIGIIKLMEMMNEILLISSSKTHGLLPPDMFDLYFDTVKANTEITSITGGMSSQQITEVIEYAARSNDVKFVVLDHLTIACSEGNRNEMFHSIGTTFRNIRQLARDLQIHILVVSHMTEDELTGEAKGWGSSNTNQIADNIIRLKRVEMGGLEKAVLSITKNRQQGLKGSFELIFDWHKQKFNEVENDSTSEGRIREENTREVQDSSEATGTDGDVRGVGTEELHTGHKNSKRKFTGAKGVSSRDSGMAKDDRVRSSSKRKPSPTFESLTGARLQATGNGNEDERETHEVED